jgi:polysaccharide export outer membrane protein
VFGEDNLSGTYTVSNTGSINFPLIGDVNVDGKTIVQVVDLIKKDLADGFIYQPRVSAQVLTYRPFYILGEVNKPGEYPCEAGLTILKAVAAAGGFTYRANTKKVIIQRTLGQTTRNVTVGIGDTVAPGDTIRVLERWF